ncbi:hypothetical protein [Streptomyces sp. NPDC002758]
MADDLGDLDVRDLRCPGVGEDRVVDGAAAADDLVGQGQQGDGVVTAHPAS